jgi:hypothetical protein
VIVIVNKEADLRLDKNVIFIIANAQNKTWPTLKKIPLNSVYWLDPARQILQDSVNEVDDLYPFLVRTRLQEKSFLLVHVQGRPRFSRIQRIPKDQGIPCMIRYEERWTPDLQQQFEAQIAQCNSKGDRVHGRMGVLFFKHFVEPAPPDVIELDDLVRPAKTYYTRNHEYSHQSIDLMISSLRMKSMKPRGVILTRSSMMEKLATRSGTTPLYVDYVKSSDDFVHKVRTLERVFVSSNSYIPEDDRQMKTLITQVKRQGVNQDVFFLYHVANNDIPEGLVSSMDWPVFWIDNVSVSPLSEISVTDIVECCLDSNDFRWNNHSNLLRIVIKKHLLDTTHGYSNVTKVDLPVMTGSLDEQHLLRLFILRDVRTGETIPDESNDVRIPKARGDIDCFINEVIHSLLRMSDLLGRPSFREVLNDLRNPIVFHSINLRQKFYLVLRQSLPSFVTRALKILLNNIRVIEFGRGDIMEVLSFVRDYRKFLCSAGQIDGHIWDQPADRRLYCPDLIRSPIEQFFRQKGSYLGALEPIRGFVTAARRYLGEQVWLIGWLKSEPWGLDIPDPGHSDDLFRVLFAHVIPHRRRASEIKGSGGLGGTNDFIRRRSPPDTAPTTFADVLLRDIQHLEIKCLTKADIWSDTWLPVKKFLLREPVGQIQANVVPEGHLLRLLLTGYCEFGWDKLSEFVQQIPAETMTRDVLIKNIGLNNPFALPEPSGFLPLLQSHCEQMVNERTKVECWISAAGRSYPSSVCVIGRSETLQYISLLH